MGSTVTDRITGLSTSVAIKAPVKAITQSNVNLYGLEVQAGGSWTESLTAGDRVLVKEQADAKENGVYTAFSTGWRRASDFNGYRDVVKGTSVPLESTGDRYRVITDNPIIIGTSEINFQLHPQDARVIPVTSRTAMKAYDVPAGTQFSLSGASEAGIFEFDSSDLSAEVAADPDEITYVAPGSDPTGASGAYVRRPVNGLVNGKLKSITDYADQYSFSGQNADLLDRIRSLAAHGDMYYRVIDSTSIGVGIGMSYDEANDDNYVVEYRFTLDGDDLLLFRGGYSGIQDEAAIRATATLSGTFVTSSINSYTTTVGDTFAVTFTGKRLIFRTRRDDQGGVWKITLSDGRQQLFSTYAATAVESEFPIFENLRHQEYTATFEFQGDDPLNPPSGGAGTSRGWFRYGTNAGDADEQPVRYGLVAPIDSATEQAVSAQQTINDFAIRARPNGATYDREWVPQHGAVSGISASVLFSLIVDEQRVASSAGTLPASGSYIECSKVSINHRFIALNPNGTDGSMWFHYITHSISKDTASMKISNRIVLQQDVDVDLGYFGMLGADSNNTSRLVLNDRTERDSLPQDDTSEEFGWGITSAFFAGEYSAGRYHGAAIKVSSLPEAVSLGDSNLQQENPILVTYRSDGISKLYWRLTGDDSPSNILPSGSVYACQHEICLVSGIRSPNTLLYSA